MGQSCFVRIIDKNTDFYDFWQNVYRDDSITFDRTDSFLLTREIFCKHLRRVVPRSKYYKDQERFRFALLQVCNTFWIFLIEITKLDEYDYPTEYTVELISNWKNYNKTRCLIRLDIVEFGWDITRTIRRSGYWKEVDKSKLLRRKETIVAAIDHNDFKIKDSIRA